MWKNTEIEGKMINHAPSFALSSPNSGYVVQFVRINAFGNSYICKTLSKIGQEKNQPFGNQAEGFFCFNNSIK